MGNIWFVERTNISSRSDLRRRCLCLRWAVRHTLDCATFAFIMAAKPKSDSSDYDVTAVLAYVRDILTDVHYVSSHLWRAIGQNSDVSKGPHVFPRRSQ